MTGSNDIRQKIVLDGEKEYSAALKEAQRNLKVLRSELKAETAELGKNATAQEKNQAKVKNLQKQIAEQEKVVKTYEKALAEVREKYSDNEEAIAKWEIKLNDARTALANMKNSLDDVSNGMKGIENSADLGVVAAHSFADSLQKVADAGGTISGAIEETFKSIAGTIADTVAQVWESVVDLAARSNNLVDLAGFWNTDVTTIQKYQGAVAEVSGTLEDLSSLVTKINSKDNKTIAELTGVSKANYKDQWQYAMAVMDAMSKMSVEQRNNAGFELFGKGATKAFDLLNDWATVQASLDKYDVSKGGFGLTEEQLNNMSDLYDKVNGLKQSWQSLKDMATVHLFGDLAMNITGNLQNIVDAFKDYFQADTPEGKAAALQKVKENIVEIFTNIKDAINEGIKLLDDLAKELQGSEDSTARALGDVLEKIVGALQWFADPKNWESVKRGFEAIISVWAIGKIGKAVGNIASFMGNLKVLGLFGGTSVASSAAAAGETAGAAWGGAFASAVMKAAPFLAFLYTLLNPAAGSDEVGNNTLVDANGNLTNEANEYGFALNENGEVYDTKTTTKEGQKYTDYQLQKIQEFWDKYRNNEITSKELFDNFRVETLLGTEEFQELMRTMNQFINENQDWRTIEDLPADWWIGGGKENGLSSEDISGFKSVPGQMRAAVREGVSGIRVTLDGYTVGNLVAPYVSEYIARDLEG